MDGPARRQSDNLIVSDSQDSHEEIDLGTIDPTKSEYIGVPEWESKPHPKPSRFNITRKKLAIAATASVFIVAGFFGAKALLASQRVITKNSSGGAPVLQGEIDPTKLRGEGDGRINLLLLGVGGDGHEGGTLSDTIMVASIDPQNKQVAMLSIPRDLYIKISGHGYAKINSANSYGGADLTKQTVSKILDLPIHYYAQADFTGFKKAVDAVGGVEVNNRSKLVDSTYPCDNNRGICPFILPAGTHKLDGKTALKYVRCRNGTCGNDFGRAERQQQVLQALKSKGLEASTLANPVKLTKLIDSVGNHLRTDLQPDELKKLMEILSDIDTSSMSMTVLDNRPGGLLVDGSAKFPGAGSILIPKAGAFDYSEIQELAHSIFVDSYLRDENATVQIGNASGATGLAEEITRKLKIYNYNVTVDQKAYSRAAKTRIIDYSGGSNPYTLKYLERRFKVAGESVQRPVNQDSSNAQPDIAIIVGSDYKAETR